MVHRRFAQRIAAAALVLAACNAYAQTLPAEMDCKDIPGAEGFLSGHQIVMIGEGHGTKEMPAAFLRMVCAALRHGNPVSVGLELPSEQREPLDKYLRSNGDDTARRELLGSAFWTENQKDGRSSAAYADLIGSLRTLQQLGFPLWVFALRTTPLTGENVKRHDEEMAARVRDEYKARPTALVLTLTGNVHSMKTQPAWAVSAFPPPMGTYLRDLDPVSINLASTGGSAWNCTANCGLHSRPVGAPAPLFVVTAPDISEAFTGQVNVGETSASYPAVEHR